MNVINNNFYIRNCEGIENVQDDNLTDDYTII